MVADRTILHDQPPHRNTWTKQTARATQQPCTLPRQPLQAWLAEGQSKHFQDLKKKLSIRAMNSRGRSICTQ
jgi:hypothetical protein